MNSQTHHRPRNEKLTEILPVHILKLKWLIHRRLFLPSEHSEALGDVLREIAEHVKVSEFTSTDNVQVIDTLYDIARAQHKRMKI